MNQLDELNQRTGGVIQELRVKAGLRQDQLGAAVGLSRASISNIEAGRQKMLLETFYQVALALDSTPTKLFTRIMSQPGTLQHTAPAANAETDDMVKYLYNIIEKEV